MEAKNEMTLNEYQKKVLSTAVYPGQGTVKGLEYCLFGALGEIGEIANKYKKILRKEENVYKYREDLMEESGDGLWYLVAFLKELGYTLEYAGQHNINKLQVRKVEGTLKERKDEGTMTWVCKDCSKEFVWEISKISHNPFDSHPCLRCEVKHGEKRYFDCKNEECSNKLNVSELREHK